jgi:hypothetical protein
MEQSGPGVNITAWKGRSFLDFAGRLRKRKEEHGGMGRKIRKKLVV